MVGWRPFQDTPFIWKIEQTRHLPTRIRLMTSRFLPVRLWQSPAARPAFSTVTAALFPHHHYSTQVDPYTDKVEKARYNCTQALSRADPSALLLSKMYPEYLRDSFLAFRSLNIELSKISFGFQPGATNKSKEFNNLKFSFWLQQLEKCEKLSLDNAANVVLGLNEPCTVLLADAILKNLNFDMAMLKQMVHSHQHFYNHNSSSGFRSLDEICSFGEGTYSQMNYLMQSVLLSPQLTGFSDVGIRLLELPHSDDLRNSLTDISAHLGQATAIGSFLIALKYFAEKKQTLMLPSDTLTKYRLPEEVCLRYLQGDDSAGGANSDVKELVKNVVFDVATLANDHLISARTKLDLVKNQLQELAATDPDAGRLLRKEKRGFPECLFLPYLSGLPTILYLERLEKYDFDMLHQSLMYKEWRLAFRLWNAERTRSF